MRRWPGRVVLLGLVSLLTYYLPAVGSIYAADTAIKGRVTLPAGVVESQNVTLRVYAEDSLNSNEVAFAEVIIPAGTHFTKFTLHLPTGLQVRLGYHFTGFADNLYLDSGYYSAGGMVRDTWSATNFSTAVSIDDLGLELPQAVEISGILSTPEGVLFAENLNVDIKASDLSGKLLGYDHITILKSHNKVEWRMLLPKAGKKAILQSSYLLGPGEFDPGPEYVNESYFNSSGTVGIVGNAELLDTTLSHTGIVFPLLRGKLVSGQISLQALDLFPSNGSVWVNLSWGENWFERLLKLVNYAAATDNVSYQIAVPPDISPYRLSYTWPDAFGPYSDRGFYDPISGVVVHYASNSGLLFPGRDYPNLDFTLLKKRLLQEQ